MIPVDCICTSWLWHPDISLYFFSLWNLFSVVLNVSYWWDLRAPHALGQVFIYFPLHQKKKRISYIGTTIRQRFYMGNFNLTNVTTLITDNKVVSWHVSTTCNWVSTRKPSYDKLLFRDKWNVLRHWSSLCSLTVDYPLSEQEWSLLCDSWIVSYLNCDEVLPLPVTNNNSVLSR